MEIDESNVEIGESKLVSIPNSEVRSRASEHNYMHCVIKGGFEASYIFACHI